MNAPTQVPFPPVVYVPTMTPDEAGSTRLTMHRVADGRTALFVYSALDRLEDKYSPDAAWVLLDVEQLQAAYDQVPYDLLLLDRRIAPSAVERHGGGESGVAEN